MADHLSQGLQRASSQAQSSASDAGNKWNAMNEEQKKQTFDNLPEEKKQGKTYTEWIKEGLHNQYENWMPWIEDQYLKWFTKDNKASYATKDTLDKSKVTGVEQIDRLQDNVHGTVSGQVGQGGLLQPIGDMASKEGINRAERSGKDDQGTCGGAAASLNESIVNSAKSITDSVGSGAQGAGGSAMSAAKSADGDVRSMVPGNKGPDQQSADRRP